MSAPLTPRGAPEFVRPFSNGTEGYDWRSVNCERCTKDGHRLGFDPCVMEEAVAKGFIVGHIPTDIAIEYGATNVHEGKPEYGHGFCRLPVQCPQFAPPTTCEFIPRLTWRKRAKCGKPATDVEVLDDGRRMAVCAKCKARCEKIDADESGISLLPGEET